LEICHHHDFLSNDAKVDMHPTSSRSIRTAPPTSDDKKNIIIIIIISHHPESDFQQLTRGSLCSNPNLQIGLELEFNCLAGDHTI
jgi:hypothetical protein